MRYSGVSASKGVRFLIVSDVALGNVLTTTKHQLGFTEPPPGYDSVHGVSRDIDSQSQFEVCILNSHT